ncbi:MAG TPA: ABC transporter ATP-binding protein [Acidimicrobiales bacterium]|nr:ABC transporter ATP-binding protein [Acidimicrobiales bacterium]
MTATITVRDVGKWFGSVVALSGVSFEIGPGVTALLGPNGAGKSTLFRIMCGLANPSQGAVRILGQDPRANPSLTRHIGIAPQQEALFEWQTALEFVTLAAQLHGVGGPVQAAAAALATVEMDPRDPRPLSTYSKGMRQRVKVAQAIVHNPTVLVLDEPLEGLDPRQRLGAISFFRALGEQGRTVVVSSHVLDEVERFGSRVLVIAQGRLVAEGDFHRIRDLMDDRPRLLRVGTDQPARVAAGLLVSGVVQGARVVRGTVEVETSDAPAFRRAVASVAREAGARLTEVVPLDEDLESVFAYLLRGR